MNPKKVIKSLTLVLLSCSMLVSSAYAGSKGKPSATDRVVAARTRSASLNERLLKPGIPVKASQFASALNELGLAEVNHAAKVSTMTYGSSGISPIANRNLNAALKRSDKYFSKAEQIIDAK